MKTLPETVTAYKRTADFTETTVPAGLLGRHTTKEGAWAMIRVLSGSLVYRILSTPPETHYLDAATPGIVEPTVPHQVQLQGPVRFYVEFYRASPAPELLQGLHVQE